MSSATPAAFLSAMSMTTTSASCLSAIPRATVAPTFPAPPTTVTLRFIRRTPPGFELQASGLVWSPKPGARSLTSSHVLDHRIPELGGADFSGIVHQAGEVVRDAFGGN